MLSNCGIKGDVGRVQQVSHITSTNAGTIDGRHQSGRIDPRHRGLVAVTVHVNATDARIKNSALTDAHQTSTTKNTHDRADLRLLIHVRVENRIDVVADGLADGLLIDLCPVGDAVVDNEIRYVADQERASAALTMGS